LLIIQHSVFSWQEYYQNTQRTVIMCVLFGEGTSQRLLKWNPVWDHPYHFKVFKIIQASVAMEQQNLYHVQLA